MLRFPRPIPQLVQIAAALLIACSSQAQPHRPLDHTLLWRISGNGLSSDSYLYGTFHIQDRLVYDFADSVLLKIRECNAFAGELHLDSAAAAILRDVARADSTDELRSLVGPESYPLRSDSLPLRRNRNGRMSRYRRFVGPPSDPWRKDKPVALDAYLVRIARLEGKEIVGLETVDEQRSIDDRTDDEKRFEGPFDDGPSAAEMRRFMQKMLTTYHDGDLEALWKMTGHDSEVDSIRARVFDNRNRNMATRIDTLIRRTSAFIAIGAAHLPGKLGVIALLRQRGFSVTPVRATRTGLAKRYVEPPGPLPWYRLQSKDLELEIDMPMEPVEIRSPFARRSTDTGLAASLQGRMFVAPDLTTGSYYLVSSLDLPVSTLGVTAESMVQSSIDRMVDTAYSQIVRQRAVVIPGATCREMYFWANGRQQFQAVRVCIVNSKMVTLAVTASPVHPATSDIERFFLSARFSEQQVDTGGRFESAEGAFSAAFSSKPRSQHVRPNDTTGVVHIFASHHDSTGVSNMVSYVDLPAGQVVVDDSTFFATISSSVGERMGATPESVRKITLDGFPGIRFRLSSAAGSTYMVDQYIRGARIYTVLTGGSRTTEAGESFQESFRFLPPTGSKWQRYTLDSPAVTVELPGPPQVTHHEVGAAFSESQTTTEVVARDDSDGQGYTIIEETYSRYFGIADTAAFFKRLVDGFVGEGDSLLAQNRVTQDGLPGIELVYKSPVRHAVIRLRCIASGNRLYQAIAYLPPDSIYSDHSDRFFTSFRPARSESATSLFTPKLRVLLDDLTSDDTVRRKEASWAIHWIDVGTEQIELLAPLMRTPRSDDTLGGARSVLLRILAGMQGDARAIDLVRKSYASLPDTLRASAIFTLFGIGTDSSYSVAKELLLESPSMAPDIAMPYYTLAWRLGNARVLFPEILSLLDRPGYSGVILRLATLLLDSGHVSPDAVAPYHDAIVAAARAEIVRRSTDTVEQWYWRSRVLESAAQTLRHIPLDAQSESLLRSLLADSSVAISRSAATTLLHHGREVARDSLRRIAADRDERIALYQDLESLGKTALFPEEYRTQRFFAESILSEWLGYELEYDDSDSIVYLADREVERVGAVGRVYLFKFSYTYDDTTRWGTAISGPQPLDRSQVSATGNGFVWSEFEPVETAPFDTQIESLLDKMAQAKLEEE